MYRLLIAGLLSVLWITPALAQPGPEEAGSRPDRIRELLIPPDLVMRNQTLLNLSSDQRNAIVKEIRQAQAQFTDLQWTLEREVDELVNLIRDRNTEEGKVIAQLDRVLGAESEIKKARLLMALRIRNALTPEQVKTLERLRNRLKNRGGRPGVAPPGPDRGLNP
jgi:Spy/CpxP family protein refolding chaperone